MFRLSSLIGVLTGLISSLTLSAASSAKPPKRPNILFILSDDHAWQAISAYGDSRHLIQTPHIDRLAKEGIKFNRCMVTDSLCGPSRASIITGTYSHINGFYNNANSVFDGSQITFPKLLQKAGYQTAMIGKWHLTSDPTGFDYWNIFPGQGQYYNPPMIKDDKKTIHPGYATDIITDLSLKWLKKRNPSKPFMLFCWNKAPHRNWQPPLNALNFDHGRVYPLPDPAHGSLFDDYSGRGVAEHNQDMNFSGEMALGYDNKLGTPKDLSPAQRKVWNAYYVPRNEAFLKKFMPERKLSDFSDHFTWHTPDYWRAHPEKHAITEWKYQRFMHDYLGCIKGVDDNVGRILKYLDDTGLAKNTIVIYSSDQGFFLGEHGWFDKRWIFQESARTPLLIRWPAKIKPGSVNDDIVSNMDIAETLLDAAGVPIPSRMQGRSMMPLLEGKHPADWRKAFYYHYYEYPDEHIVRPHYGLITKRYTLVHFYKPKVKLKAKGPYTVNSIPSGYWELFDRFKDPGEMKSVFGEPAYQKIQTKLMKDVAQLRVKFKEPATDDPKAFGPQE